MGFTGKEADEEVGLVYFGQRYLIPRIARWSTPDPLQIHALGGGEPFNSYHYVSGNLLQATDPVGLENPAPASSASVDAQSTPGTERALGEAVRVSTLPTSSDGRPLAQLHDGDFFMGGPGPDMNRAAPVDRAAWVQYAHAHHLPIFVFLPGSDAPTFEQAVAQRQETTSGRAIAVLSLLAGAIPSPSGVNGGVPFGVGHHSAPTAIGLLLALGAAALNVFGAVIGRAAQGANAARGAAAANAARGAEAAAGGEGAAQAGLSRLGSSVQRALDRLRGARRTGGSTAARGAGGHPTFRPGPHAGESIPARSTSQRFTAAERTEMNRIGETTGCHTCGTTNPGTRSGNFVPDHQPPSALAPEGTPQQLYPQCINCSREQGLAIARQRRGQ